MIENYQVFKGLPLHTAGDFKVKNIEHLEHISSNSFYIEKLPNLNINLGFDLSRVLSIAEENSQNENRDQIISENSQNQNSHKIPHLFLRTKYTN